MMVADRFDAKVEVLLLVSKVPAVALVQEFVVPLVPAVSVPHEKPEPVSLRVKVVALPG